MKAKINYRSKKTIIIISVAVVLLIAAIVGTVAFVKGNQDAAAAMTDDGTSTSQNDGANAGLPNNGDQNNGDDQNNNGTTLPEVGDNTNPADSNNNGNNGSTTNGGTTGTNGANGSNTGANAGTTTGTTTTGNNGANVPNQDYTQTTVIPGRDNVLVEQNTEIGWSPISVAAYTAVSKLKVHKPDLELQKYAYLDGDSLEELPVNTAVQKGETITYVIKITNKGNEDANGIRTIDTIPEGTELASISEGGKLNNDGKIVWKNDIKAGETVTVSFKVVVTADSIDLINNIAKVNGEETPETKTPVITANKTAQVVTKVDKEEVIEKRDAKVGETIRYTITAKNTSEVDGTTVITDSIPDGTTLVDETITENGNYDKESKTITWNNVVVPAKGEVSVSFDVVVNEKTTAGEDVKSVKNTATVGNTPTEEVETKVANITTVKTSVGEHADGTPVTEENPLHELDKITYTLTATNNGNGKGTVKISDTIPEGATLVGSIELDGKSYTEAQLNAGIDVTLEAGKEKSITFTVTINPFEDEKITVRNADAKQDGTEVPPTEDEVIKEYVSIDVNKKFVDKDNIDKYRPGEVTVGLYSSKDSKESITTIKLDERNGWKGSFTGLNKYDLETKALIDYDVREINVNKNYNDTYTSEKEGDKVTFDVTNTLKYENVKTSVTAKKIWNDNDGKVGARASVTFELYKDGKATGITQIASDAEDINWTVTFQDLQKYKADGTEIEYTVVEVTRLPHYAEPVYGNDGNVLTVTNKIDYTTFTKDVSVKKIWVDPANTEHEDITINLYQSGNNEIFRTETLDKNTTNYTFTSLPKYDENGDEYTYTAQEVEVKGYTTSYSDDTLKITNTINQDNTVEVSGTKIWIVPEGTKYPTITIRLIKNGTKTENKAVLDNGKTSYSFTNLPRYQVDENGNYILDENGNVKLNVYTVEEDEVGVGEYETTYSQDHTTEITNKIKQDTSVKVSGTKTWADPEGTTLVHPAITINLLMNGEKYRTTTIETGNTKYEFTGLPKYKVDKNGNYVLKNGYVQLNEYTIEEVAVKNYDTTYDGYNITNTFNQDIQGTVEITTTTTSQTSVKTPLDVVFVLDISGSMNENDKDKTMVDSVNTAISTIMNENPESRVGVIAYSSTHNSNLANANNATTLLPLGKYTPKTEGKYLTLQENVLSTYDEYYHKYEYYDTITTNVNEMTDQTLNVYGGTYTQAGIKAGAELLTSNSNNTKYTTTVNGKLKEITRTPVMILLSDGDPTYYNEDYKTLSKERNGNGINTTENEAYYTIRTADCYKRQITSKYYGTTGTKSKFYTIGLNMSGTLSETILNPTSANVNKCNDEGGNWWSRNVKGKLYDKIIADGVSGGAGKYSYADQSYVSSMTTSDLQSIFNTIINDNSTSTETRDITVEESNARRVNLEGIDTSKAFTLTIGNNSYNFAQATSNGYVKGNNTDGYYVDLSNLEKGTTISISYNK